jgi:hypothetical protein
MRTIDTSAPASTAFGRGWNMPSRVRFSRGTTMENSIFRFHNWAAGRRELSWQGYGFRRVKAAQMMARPASASPWEVTPHFRSSKNCYPISFGIQHTRKLPQPKTRVTNPKPTANPVRLRSVRHSRNARGLGIFGFNGSQKAHILSYNRAVV